MTRRRRTLLVLALVVASALAPLALLGVWFRTSVAEADGYLRTARPVATNAAVQNTVTDRVVALVEPHLPAGVARNAGAALVRRVVSSLLRTQQATDLWEQINRITHDQFMSFVRTDQSNLTVSDGMVWLDLNPLITELSGTLRGVGIDISAESITAPRIALFHSQHMPAIRRALRDFDSAALVLPWVAGALFLLVCSLWRPWFHGVLWSAVGVAAAMLVLGILYVVGRTGYLSNAVGAGLPRDTAGALHDIVTRDLRTQIIWTGSVAAGLALAGWVFNRFAPPGRHSVRLISATRGGAAR